MMTNQQTMSARIARAQTIADCDKLDKSLERLWKHGIFSAEAMGTLDDELIRRRIAIEETTTTE